MAPLPYEAPAEDAKSREPETARTREKGIRSVFSRKRTPATPRFSGVTAQSHRVERQS